MADAARLSANLFNMLPKFAGDLKEDFLLFIRNFEKVTDAMNLQAACRNRLLPVCLTGFAETEYFAAPAESRETYEDIKQYLKDQFLRAETQQQNMTELMKRKQGSRESISAYVTALRNLSSRSFNGQDPVILDQMLHGISMEGVLPRYRMPLVIKSPPTFKEAIDIAIDLEACLTTELGAVAATSQTSDSTTAQLCQNVQDLCQMVTKLVLNQEPPKLGIQRVTVPNHGYGEAQPSQAPSPNYPYPYPQPSYQFPYQPTTVPLPPNPYYPQQNSEGFRSFPENSSPRFRFCTNCQKGGHDNAQCWSRRGRPPNSNQSMPKNTGSQGTDPSKCIVYRYPPQNQNRTTNQPQPTQSTAQGHVGTKTHSQPKFSISELVNDSTTFSPREQEIIDTVKQHCNVETDLWKEKAIRLEKERFFFCKGETSKSINSETSPSFPEPIPENSNGEVPIISSCIGFSGIKSSVKMAQAMLDQENETNDM